MFTENTNEKNVIKQVTSRLVVNKVRTRTLNFISILASNFRSKVNTRTRKLYSSKTYIRRGAVVSGAGSNPVGSVGRDLNSQKLNYQYLTTSVTVVLVVRWYFNG